MADKVLLEADGGRAECWSERIGRRSLAPFDAYAVTKLQAHARRTPTAASCTAEILMGETAA